MVLMWKMYPLLIRFFCMLTAPVFHIENVSSWKILSRRKRNRVPLPIWQRRWVNTHSEQLKYVSYFLFYASTRHTLLLQRLPNVPILLSILQTHLWHWRNSGIHWSLDYFVYKLYQCFTLKCSYPANSKSQKMIRRMGRLPLPVC